jgi:polyisoprenoid-binding protein YceI
MPLPYISDNAGPLLTMRTWKLCSLLLCGALLPASAQQPESKSQVKSAIEYSATPSFAAAHYRLDPGQSRFIVRAFSGGLLWFEGHDHLVAVRDFSGDVQLTPGATPPASLQMTIRADSLQETRDVFTDQQKQIINKELREIVLETATYPKITFKSTEITGQITGGQFEVKIGGDLTLHGVTRHILIPADITLSGNTLRARGQFTVNRSDYNVKATSAAHGLVRVRDKLQFTFDIAAHQI